MKFRSVAIIAALLLLNLDLLAPEAAALPQQTNDQWELWNQVQPTTAAQESNIANSIQTFTLTIGHTYYFLYNLQQGTNSHNHLGSGVGLFDIGDFSGDSNPTFGSKVVTGTGKVISSQNITNTNSRTFNYQVAIFTMNATVTANSGIAGTGQGANQYSFPQGSATPCARTGLIGYVGSFAYTGGACTQAEDGILFEASIARQSEVSVTANQMTIDSSHVAASVPLNPDVNLYPAGTACSGTTKVGSQYGLAQSLTLATPDGRVGKFLRQTSFRIDGANPTGGTTEKFTFRLTPAQAVSNAPDTGRDVAWGNFTLTIPSGSTGTDVTIDWVRLSINKTDITGSWSIATNDFTQGVVGPNLSANPTLFLQVIMASGETERSSLNIATTCGNYGGNVTFNGSTVTTDYIFASNQFPNVYAISYGKDSYSFQLNATVGNVAGAIYVILTETLLGGEFGANFGTITSTYDGVALPTSTTFSTANTITRMFRLNFPIDPTNLGQSGPWNTTGQWAYTFTPPDDARELYSSQGLTNQPVNTTNVAQLLVPNLDGYSGGTTGLKVFQLFTTNDFFTQVVILPQECINPNCIDSGTGVFNNTAFPNDVPITVTINHGGILRTIVVTTANQFPTINVGATANFSGQDISGATLTLVYGGPQVQTQTWTGFNIGGSGSWTLTGSGAYVSSGGGSASGGSTTNIVCVPSGSNFAIGSQALLNVTWLTGGYYALFQIQASGLPGQITSVYQLAATPLPQTITYPTGRNASLSPINDTGSYIVALMDGSQKLQTTCTFSIGNSSIPTVDATMLSVMNSSLSQQVLNANLDANQKTQQSAAHDFILDAATFAFRTDIYIPNLYLFLLLCMVVGVFMAAVRGRSQ